MSLKQGAVLGMQMGLSVPEPAGHCSFGPALELEPPPRNLVGEGSTDFAAQWDWSPAVCCSQQEWAPSMGSSSDRRGVSGGKKPWHPGTHPAAGTPHGTTAMTLPNSGTSTRQRADPWANSTPGLSGINPAKETGLLFRRDTENPAFVFFRRFQC